MISGFTLRQLQWLDEKELFQPYTNQKHRRIYRRNEVLSLCVLRALRRKKMTLHSFRKIRVPFCQAVARLNEQLGHIEQFFATDGVTVVIGSPTIIVAFSLEATSPVYVVSVDEQRKRLEWFDGLKTKAAI